jgi:hypothetical protein
MNRKRCQDLTPFAVASVPMFFCAFFPLLNFFVLSLYVAHHSFSKCGFIELARRKHSRYTLGILLNQASSTPKDIGVPINLS